MLFKSGIRISLVSCLLLCAGRSDANPQFMQIIRDVQIKSQEKYDVIDSVAFEGHTKTYVYFHFKPFDFQMIPYLEEYYFDGFWTKPDSLRLAIHALRIHKPDDDSTMNIQDWLPLPNPFRFIHDPSSIGMENSEKGDGDEPYWPMYPFSVGADSVYDYKRTGEIVFEDNRVWIVAVKTRDPKTPGMTGTFYIDPLQKTVVGSDVIFNEAASVFAPDVNTQKTDKGFSLNLSVQGSDNHRIKTKQALFYGTYWLPVQMEEEFEVHFMGIRLNIRRLIDFDAYLINPGQEEIPALADSGKQVALFRDPELEAELFPEPGPDNRLSLEEQEALIRRFEDHFMSMSLVSDLLTSDRLSEDAVGMGLEKIGGRQLRTLQNIGKVASYNRVEGLGLHCGISARDLIPGTSIALSGSYGFKDQRWKGEAGWFWFPGGQKRFFIEGNAFRTLGFEEDQKMISTTKNSWTSLLFKEDYRDYYYKQGFSAGLGLKLTDNLAIKLDAVHQDETSAVSHSQLSLFRYKSRFRLNPQIAEGLYRGIEGRLLWRTHNWQWDLFGTVADKDLLGGDFTFKTIQTHMARTFRTGYHTRLYLFLNGMWSDGALPPQRWADFGGKIFMDYHGHLRGIGYKSFTGDKTANAMAEYSINGSALHEAGLKWSPLKLMKFSLWSGAGWSELLDESLDLAKGLNTSLITTDNLYHEFGLGLSDRFNILRLDIIRNSLEGNKILFHVNFMK